MKYFDYYTDFYARLFDHIYITQSVKHRDSVRRAVSLLKGLAVHFIADKEEIPEEHRNAKTLFITEPRGQTVDHCPGSKGHVCCNYLTVDLYLGCTLGCSYCIMKNYLNFSPITVYAPPGPSAHRIESIVADNPDRTLRIGTGEVGDSLLLDPLFDYSKEFITRLSEYSNVYFELKTKTDFVDHLLSVGKKGNAVIGFSLNPDEIIESEEPYAASLEKRFAAAEKAVEAGYLLSFHFDPIIRVKGWKRLYRDVARRLSRFPSEKIAWISMGTFRYPPKLKDGLAPRPYMYDEFVPCNDGKYRYLQKVRIGMYAEVLQAVREECAAPVYLCMESETVWNRVFGALPHDMDKTRPIFTQPRNVPFFM